jgi:hypothetical protein
MAQYDARSRDIDRQRSSRFLNLTGMAIAAPAARGPLQMIT